VGTPGPDQRAQSLAKEIVRATAADLATHREYLESAQYLIAMDLPFLTLGNIESKIRFEDNATRP